MKKKVLKYSSNLTLIAGAVLGIYALTDIYLLRSRLPAGICPVTSNRPLIYIAIALCCISFFLSLFEPKGEDTVSEEKNSE